MNGSHPSPLYNETRQTCRHLYEPDGRFTEHHLQDWQHSAMYLAFMLAGVVDMMAHYTQLPSGIDQVVVLVTPLERGHNCWQHLSAIPPVPTAFSELCQASTFTACS